MHRTVADIKAASRDRQQLQLSEITRAYPFYEDFDTVGVREFVLYEDALSSTDYENVLSHYGTLIRFQALQGVLNSGWSHSEPTSDEELEFLEEYVRRLNDTRFRARLEQAISEFEAWDRGRWNSRDEPIYETSTFTARRVAHFAESRYGVHFKDTDEYGLYGVFHADDNSIYTGLYRTDASFEKEIYLGSSLLRMASAGANSV